MMSLKNIKTFAAFILVALVMIGCEKDDSNTSVTPINQIKMVDPKTAAQLIVFQGDYLNLKPTLSQTMSDKLDQLEFSWIVYNSNGAVSLAAPRIEIAKTYELNYLVKGDPFVLGETYVVRLQAKDKNTGVSSYIDYNILIGNKYGTGWLVLEDKAGKGDLSFVFTDFTTEMGIYNDRNTAAIIGPKKLEITTFAVTDDISDAGKRMYILADQGSQEYNYLTMVKKFDYGFLFFSAPAIEKPTVMTWVGQYSGTSRFANLGIAINNGKLHSNLVGGFPGVKKWGDVALNPQGNQNYSLAPYVVGGETFPAIVYDNTSKRFYRVQGFNPTPVAGTLETFPSGSSSTVSSVFDMNDVGLTMLFQDSADVVNDYNAIMKNDANEAYLLRYKTRNTSNSPTITLGKTLMNAPGILTATAASGSTTTPHIYYSNGNVVSRYETSSNTVVETFGFPAGENVTCIKYIKNFIDRTGPKLAVSTWNGSNGKIYYFSISATGAMGNYTKMVSGFSKIVDMAYKY